MGIHVKRTAIANLTGDYVPRASCSSTREYRAFSASQLTKCDALRSNGEQICFPDTCTKVYRIIPVPDSGSSRSALERISQSSNSSIAFRLHSLYRGADLASTGLFGLFGPA
ncbi:hypothetical protein ACEPPN_000521 [Leptodophora sp. 'Broadleaf-Isolate-01']